MGPHFGETDWQAALHSRGALPYTIASAGLRCLKRTDTLVYCSSTSSVCSELCHAFLWPFMFRRTFEESFCSSNHDESFWRTIDITGMHHHSLSLPSSRSHL